jgi:DNA polymerase III epsilon subunit-like protein
MKLLLLDTETNGLPRNRYAPISEPGVYPAILQLSWAIYTVVGKTLIPGPQRDIGLTLHHSIPWDTGAAAIHGISEVEARTGTAPVEALTDLGVALRSVDAVIAHNLAFDKTIIRAAGYAEGLRALWPLGLQEFCTMKSTKDLVCIPATAKQAQYADLGAYKAPKLNELHAWLYGHAYDISGATLHSAASDTHCLARCVAALLRRGHLRVEELTLIFSPTSLSESPCASPSRAAGEPSSTRA